MAASTGSWLGDILILVTSLFIFIYLYYLKNFRHWKRLNVPFLEPSFPYGNLKNMFKDKTGGEVMWELHERGQGQRYIGAWMFWRPMLMIRDPDLIRAILVKDFMNFHDRGFYVNERDDPLAGKMKMMFPSLAECSVELKDVLEGHASRGDVIDVKEFAARFTTDTIASCAFGLQTNSLKNPDAIFRIMGKKLFQPSRLQIFNLIIQAVAPDLAYFLHLKQTPKEISDFFIGVVKETMDYREANEVTRADFLQLLIQLKNTGVIDDEAESKFGEKTTESRKLTFEEAAAQAFIFFAAGFETSSTTMQFALYELAVNVDVQDKLRKEILKVLSEHSGQMTYESVHAMDYLGRVIDEPPWVTTDSELVTASWRQTISRSLDRRNVWKILQLYDAAYKPEFVYKFDFLWYHMTKHLDRVTIDIVDQNRPPESVVLETLRKYPPLFSIQRECTKDYQVPDSDLVITKGTVVHMASLGIHMDPTHYPQPEKFDPDRFTDKEKAKRHHYVYLPFGEGPRNCIGMRFGLMQTRVGLITLLSNFRFEVAEETTVPVKFDQNAFILSPRGGMNLRITKL